MSVAAPCRSFLTLSNMYAGTPPTSEETLQRQLRLQDAHEQLFTHPALTTAPAPPYPSPPSEKNGTEEDVPHRLMHALFDDVLRRELGVDASHPISKVACTAHLARTRAVVTHPSLAEPSFVTSLSKHLPAIDLPDRKVLAAIAPKPLDPPPATPSARTAHELLQRRRAEREAVDSAKRSARPDTPSSVKSPKHELVDDMTGRRTRSRRARSLTQLGRRSSGRRERAARACCFCPDSGGVQSAETEKGAELLGPFANPKSPSGAGLFVHFECACWAPQVFTDTKTNQLRRVYEEYCRGRQLKCSHCFGRGATVGCYVQKCKKVFHFRCLSPAGAFRVERFFVAFCDRHAHLARKGSYQILMEAATIADVAAAHRKDDKTFGLDAPHSRHTKLRRSETEVIFSTIWKVSSTPAAFENSMVIFSHRRRAILNKHEKFVVGDGLRALRMSAIDVASGRLAYASVVGKCDDSIEMSAIEARAALASPDSNGIFLLRNLRRAPKWKKEHIALIKSSSFWVERESTGSDDEIIEEGRESDGAHSDGKPGGGKSVLTFEEPCNGIDVPVLTIPKEDKTPNGAEKKRRRSGRQVKCQRGQSSSVDGSGDKNQTPGTESTNEEASSQLPSLKRPKRSGSDIDCVQPSAVFSDKGDAATSAFKTSLQVPTEEQTGLSRVGLRGKVKSAWETFLEDHLHKERLLRPEDSHEDAMRNMARLWSLMTTVERAAFSERARNPAAAVGDWKDSTGMGEPSTLHAYLEQSKRRGKRQSEGATRASKRNVAGLFANSGNSPPGNESDDSKEGDASATPRMSVSLPRGERKKSKTIRRRDREDQAPVDLDDMFPQSIDVPNSQSGDDTPRVSVRKPPPPRKHR